jgi:transcriptional regulator with XRE-family HTH domain
MIHLQFFIRLNCIVLLYFSWYMNHIRGSRAACRTMTDVRIKKKKKTARSPRKLTALDDFLKAEGKLEEFEAIAIKEVLAWQLSEAMKAGNMSRKRLAERMKTSRSQISRLLDPKDGNVTIATLQRAARMVGRTLRLELV